MPYQITDDTWLTAQTNRARGVLVQHMVRGQSYTVDELLAMLAYCGLHFDNPTYLEIGLLLIADGTIEQGS